GFDAFVAGDGAVENDGAAVGDEVEKLLDGEEGAFDVDVEDKVELLFSDLAEGDKFTDAGVGEDDVDAAVLLRYVIMELVEVGEFGDVAHDSFHVLANG